MVTLSYDDLLDLLGYVRTGRRPLEILGYEYSTRGARRFRSERPDVLSQVCRWIEADLETAGTFPREPSIEVLEGGTYLERRPGGIISLHTSGEVSMSQTARIRCDFGSVQKAIFELLRVVSDPAILPLPPT